MRADVVCAGHDAERRAEAVHVGILVSHDEHVAAVFKQLEQRLREQTRLDTRLAGVVLALAAVEAVVRTVLDDDLIAASAERKFDRAARILFRLREPRRDAEADRERDGGGGAGVDAVRLFEQGKAFLLELLQLLRFQNEQEPPVVVAPVQTAEPLGQIGDQPFDLGEHRRAVHLRVAQKFLVVVDHDERHVRSLLGVQALVMHGLGAVDPVLEHEFVLVFALYEHVHDLIVAAVQLDLQHAGRLFAVEVRRDLLHAGGIGQRGERVVVPLDASGKVEHRAGNRDVLHERVHRGLVVRKDPIHARLLMLRDVVEEQRHHAHPDQPDAEQAERDAVLLRKERDCAGADRQQRAVGNENPAVLLHSVVPSFLSVVGLRREASMPMIASIVGTRFGTAAAAQQTITKIHFLCSCAQKP